MNKLKSLVVTAVLLNSITVPLGTREEREAFERFIAEQSAEIRLHRATAMEIFKSFSVPESALKATADSIVLDSTGLGHCIRLAKSSITATPTTSSPLKFLITTDTKYETGVRIFIELLAHLGMHHPTRTWDPSETLAETSLRHIKPWLPVDTKKNIYDWVLEQTHSLMEILGDPARVIPGATIRGGISASADKTSMTPIIAKMLTTKEIATVERINHELNDLLDNALTFKWFARLGPDKAKRATFIALCLDLSMGGIALTDEEFKTNYNFAQTLALAK